MKNIITDFFIALILGLALFGILIFDDINDINTKIFIAMCFSFLSWFVFWTDRKKLKQPISGILTFIRTILANIIDMIVVIISLLCSILPFFALLGFVGEFLFGETGSIIGCIIGIIIGFPFGIKLAIYLKNRFLEERLTNKDLIKLVNVHEANRIAFLKGKNYFYPLTLLIAGPIFIFLFFYVYPDFPSHETFLFFPFGIIFTLLGVLGLFNYFSHFKHQKSIDFIYSICVILTIITTILINCSNHKYSIFKIFN